MDIITGTTDFGLTEQTAVAIGKFDGFHRGHQRLIEKIKEQKARGLASVVFTFTPSPAAYFSKEPLQELTTREEKRRIFEWAGVDYLIEYPFYSGTADMSPVAFIRDVLVGRLQAKCIVAGEDISYGRAGAGDYRLLSERAAQYGYEVMIIDKVRCNGREVSSTYVREALGQGDMELVTTLLGAPYQVGGAIVHGRHLGTSLGMPTANLIPPEGKLLPPNGVYYSRLLLQGQSYAAITNIGVKPTVDGEGQMGVETYVYDFDRDVYGQEAQVSLLAYRRPEQRFDSVEALQAQMQADIAAGREFHKTA